MEAAFSCWNNRIAPVFDTAPWIRIVKAESGKIVGETNEYLPDGQPMQTALCLAEMRVAVLVCGAISRPLSALIEAYGIEVIPFVAGELEKVIHAWISGGLDPSLFSMPGCGLRRRHRHRRGAHIGNHSQWGKIRTRPGGVKPGAGRHRGKGRLGSTEQV